MLRFFQGFCPDSKNEFKNFHGRPTNCTSQGQSLMSQAPMTQRQDYGQDTPPVFPAPLVALVFLYSFSTSCWTGWRVETRELSRLSRFLRQPTASRARTKNLQS